MRFTVVAAIAIAMVAGAFGSHPVQAQNLRDVQAPAEFPPASYKGNQYVDSQGCVYIRADIDGNITWVPRVNRQRNLLCGQTPTRVARSAPASAPTVQAPQQITIDAPAAPAAKPSVAPTAPAPRVATALAPAPAPQRRAVATPSPAPDPTVFTTAKDTGTSAPNTVPATPQTTTQRRVGATPSPAPAPTVFRSSKEEAADAQRTVVATSRQTTSQRRTVAGLLLLQIQPYSSPKTNHRRVLLELWLRLPVSLRAPAPMASANAISIRAKICRCAVDRKRPALCPAQLQV